jgi:copper transport protein
VETASGGSTLVRRSTPALRTLVVLAVPLFVVFVWSPGVALAHSVLASSQPAAGQRLGTAPGVVLLGFTEPLNRPLSRAVVTDPTGRRFTGGASGDEEIRVPLSTNAPGVYRVDWTTVSTLDGHTWRGSFEFGVGVAPGAAPTEAGVGPGGDDLLLAIGRWVEALALLLAMGMLLLRRLARGRPELGWVRVRIAPVLGAALVAGLAVVVGEAATASGSFAPSGFLGYVTVGLPGWARVARLACEALAVIVALLGWPSLWLWTVGAVVALAASGHGAAITPTWWGVTVDAVHLLAAGLWAGGILALATVRPPGGWRGPAARALLARFSPPALTAFAVTVGFGAIEGIQELGGPGALVASPYGRVLLAKILLVALMVPLSFVAWRVRGPRLRIEATLAVGVVAAAAVLAAFPVPPSRLVDEEAARRIAPQATALPREGDLTMADHAGQVLVGLTLRPARPGTNQVLVYLLPIEGEKAAGSLRAHLLLGGTSPPLARCGDTCRRATVDLQGDQDVSVRVDGPKGGLTTFHLPSLPAPGGAALLQRAEDRIHRLRSYRLFETLNSGIATIAGRYAYQAPNRMASTVNGSQTVWVGGTRYMRERPGAPWKVERGGPSIPVPKFIWDYFAPFVSPRIVGAGRVDGEPVTIVSFFAGREQGTPVWFELWIDPSGLVLRAHMRAIGHFMDDHYFGFDAPLQILPPVP